MNKEKLKSFLSQIKPDRWDCDILCEMIDNLTDDDIMGLLSENRSCENCNIGVKNHDDTITCMIKAYPEDKYSGDILKGKYYYRVNNSFCCNSWEKKL